MLIDHKTASGFEAIAEAREYLLKLGKKDLEDLQDHNETDPVLKGSHIIAPVCLLYDKTPTVGSNTTPVST